MSAEFIRRFLVAVVAAVVAFLLFDYYHGDLKYNFVRLTTPHGGAAIYAGEILPALIILAASLYCLRKVPEADEG